MQRILCALILSSFFLAIGYSAFGVANLVPSAYGWGAGGFDEGDDNADNDADDGSDSDDGGGDDGVE